MKKSIKQPAKQLKSMHSLGRELVFNPQNLAIENAAGYEVKYFDKTIEVLVGIGKDETASLIMTMDAWNAFKGGEEIHIYDL